MGQVVERPSWAFGSIVLAVGLRLANGIRRMGFLDRLAHQDLLDLDVGIARVSEHRVKLALRRLPRHLGKPRDARDGGLSVLALDAPFARGGDHDRAPHAGVVGLEPEGLAATPQDARHPFIAAGHDAQDLPFRAAARAGDEARGHQIAMHGSRHALFGNVEVVLETDTRHEAETARVNAEDALAFGFAPGCGLGLRTKTLPGVWTDDPGRREVGQHAQEARVSGILDMEACRDLARVEGAGLAVQELENGLAARQWTLNHEQPIPQSRARRIFCAITRCLHGLRLPSGLSIGSLVAIAVSSALLIDYYRPLPAFCDVGSVVTRFAPPVTAAGAVPVPLVGLLAFTSLMAISLVRNEAAQRITRVLAILGGAFGILLLSIQAFYLHVFCKLCVAVDVAAIVATVAALLSPRSSDVAPPSGYRWLWPLGTVFAMVLPGVWSKIQPSPPVPSRDRQPLGARQAQRRRVRRFSVSVLPRASSEDGRAATRVPRPRSFRTTQCSAHVAFQRALGCKGLLLRRGPGQGRGNGRRAVRLARPLPPRL
jgi:hypothetical protein